MRAACGNLSREAVAATKFSGGPAQRPVPSALAADEADLVRLAGNGDGSAFRTLTDRHLGSILAVARRMLQDRAEAEDVSQETLLRLWRSGATLEIGPAGVRPWLRRVVSNLCLDRVRSQGRVTVVEELPEVPDEPKQLSALEDRATQKRVVEALQKLPERQRLALTLFHFEGMSQIEVGQAMGVSDEAVESLLGRARRQLKAELKDEWQSLRDGSGG